MDPARRTHARFPCDLKVVVHTGPVGGLNIGEGVVLDLSLTGALLRFAGLMKVGATYRLSLKWAEGVLDLPCRVARDAGRSAKAPAARHFGLTFNLTYDQEKALMRLIDQVRRGAGGEDGFMRGYWG